MNSRCDIELFRKTVSSIVRDSSQTLESRIPGLVSPTFSGQFKFSCRKLHREESLIQLAFLHWYFEDSLRITVRIWLEDLQLTFATRERIDLILSNRAISEMYFSDLFSSRSLFGNLISAWKEILGTLKPLQEHPKKARRVQRKRGYQDHGTLRSSSKWRESHDWSFTEFQNELEYLRKESRDTAAFLEGWYS